MALKDDLNSIKKELSTQEQMIEGFIRGEKFFKKYKYIILTFVIAIFVYILYQYISDSIRQRNIKNSNELYISLLKQINTPQYDFKMEESLKEDNPNLYVFLLFARQLEHNKILEESKNLNLDPLLRELINSNEKDSKFLSDYNKILEAYALLKQNKIEGAKILLNQIPNISELRQIADNLKHYQGR